MVVMSAGTPPRSTSCRGTKSVLSYFLDTPHRKPSHYRVIPGHRNWQIETAFWNLAGFLHCALETHYQRFMQFLNDFLKDFLYENLNFPYENLKFLYENLRFSL